MAKARLFRRGNTIYLELPDDIANYSDLELFRLKEGYYLLSLPLEERKKEKKKETKINEEEQAVLRKLISIRFENRTPEYVAKVLPKSDKAILKDLEQKGLVNVFKGKKYKNGVYNIKDSIYPVLTKRKESTQVQPQQQKQQQSTQNDDLKDLKNRGFLILNDKNQAFKFSQLLNREMKDGSVLGVKGFDGKVYIVTRNYLSKAQESIGPILKEEMDTTSIATIAKLDPDGCMAVLRLMAEQGEVIEKKRGVFAPI